MLPAVISRSRIRAFLASTSKIKRPRLSEDVGFHQQRMQRSVLRSDGFEANKVEVDVPQVRWRAERLPVMP